MERSNDFFYLCEESELHELRGKRFYVNDTDIAIFRIGVKIFAVSNVCPHQQAEKIFEGFIEDECVICPLHGWKFNLIDGKLANGSRGLETFPTKIIDGKIYALVIPKKLNW